MGDRWLHRLVGFIFYIGLVVVFIAISILRTEDIHELIPWLVMGFGLCMFGAEIPDYDQYPRSGFPYFYLLTHRSGLTHSPIFPSCLFILVGVLAGAASIAVASILLTSFLVGHASHLFLDLFPSPNAKKSGQEYRKTSYCLHFIKRKGRCKSGPYRKGTMVCLAAFGFLELFLGVWALKVIPILPFGWL